ncbi:polysaccharide biosynthesis protein [Edwardsiella piscicida]|uniref:polysaccharide biosynthesis protein n=1 Tax=Edwardsiella piscicida TaxID=1263550 RepID=UPI00084C9E48|nr:polysaccharide biosynthesis protein [Edwardsiella piscicida]AOP44112.1 polysaccharide biosynthesis protein [Edwardsiella piscicida]EKS7767651.1 polysaccharide biosynthesis protein [Edwardsiella piscicida]UCQ30724.1 polysaccharide biosynthesis protein [Edwardsiella piscicida]UCQ57052.1 polysaccharide biosynthesis protein [Edwardsiella piscicida]
MFIKHPVSPGEDDDVDAELDEHLRFYQLCGVMAAASSVLLTLMMVLMFPGDFKERTYMLAGVYLGPVTLLLLLGMLRFPRICAWALLIGFNALLLYLFLRGTAFNLAISFLFVLFFLFGAIATTQRQRQARGAVRPLWLARRGWRPVLVLMLLALLISSFSSGFALRWLDKKRENPLLWIEYRRQMLGRYQHLTVAETPNAPGIWLRRVRLEGRTLVFVYRVRLEGEAASEASLRRHALSDFLQHCHERGVRQFGMKVMYVYRVHQEERILVLNRRDCVE